MKCLESILGLRGVCEDSEHLCYINDEITLKLFSKLSNTEDVSGKNFFERIRRKASEEVASDFINALGDAYQWNDVIKTETKGTWDKKSEIECKSSKIGRRICKDCSDPYLSAQVVSIEINVKDGHNDFKYYVKEKDCEAKEYCTSLSCGRNVLDINYTGDYVEIYFQGDGIEWYNANAGCGCSSSSSCGCGSCYRVENICSDIEGNFESYDKTPFSVCVNCICNPEALICKYRMYLKQAMTQRTAAFFWEEFEGTCRKNNVSIGLAEDAEVKYAKIMGGFNTRSGDKYEKRDSKYWGKIWNAAKRVKGSIKPSRCVKCRGLRYQEQI